MEIQATSAAPAMVTTAAPPAPVADQRPTAVVAALAHDATPENPMPMPPVQSQKALVGQLMIKEPEESLKTADDGPLSEAQRTLKPYGVSLLPERHP